MVRDNIINEREIEDREVQKRGLTLDQDTATRPDVSIGFDKDRFHSDLQIDQTQTILKESIKNIVSQQKIQELEQKFPQELQNHTIYLFNEYKPNLGLKTFSYNIRKDVATMALTRRHPELLPHDDLDFSETIFYWLTTNQGEFCIDPTNISRLYRIISEFIDDFDKTLIYLDGLEYLISRNSFSTVIKFLYSINDKVMINDTVMLLSTYLETYSSQETALLLREIRRPGLE